MSSPSGITTDAPREQAKAATNVNREQVYVWIQELLHPDTREHALIELSKKREVLPELAPLLWHSFGTMAALLQEIVMIYPVINPPTLTVSLYYFMCNYLIASVFNFCISTCHLVHNIHF